MREEKEGPNCRFRAYFFVSLLFPDAGGHVSVFVRDGCIFFI